jgi:hypothetical protein
LKLLKDKKNREISSSRLGVDMVIYGFNMGQYLNFSFLGFGVVEQVTAAEQPETVAVEEDADLALSLTKINYTLGFLGLGIAVSW